MLQRVILVKFFTMTATKYMTVSRLPFELRYSSVVFHRQIRNIVINNCLSFKIKKHESNLENNEVILTKEVESSFPLQEDRFHVWMHCIDDNALSNQRVKFEEFLKQLVKLIENNESYSNYIPNILLENYEKILNQKEQIFEMAVLLKCSPEQAFKAILKHHFLLHSRISTLKIKVDLLSGNGITLADLRKDLWVLSYTKQRLESRINKIQKFNLSIKCWMLRCKEDVLNRTWENREENKAATLPFTNSQEYLCDRLKMNENQLLLFSRRHPAVLKVKMAKLKEVLEHLLSEGFTSAQIYYSPRILCHSIRTIKHRLSILRDRHHGRCTLSILCKSVKEFEIYIQKLEKPLQR